MKRNYAVIPGGNYGIISQLINEVSLLKSNITIINDTRLYNKYLLANENLRYYLECSLFPTDTFY